MPYARSPVPPRVPADRAEPDGSTPDVQADYWVKINSGRWAEAVELERSTGLAICDSDPLKLHYSWCLAATGAAPWIRFERELQHCRFAFASGHLGLADLVLVSTVSDGQLRRQREADASRRRRSFDLHVRLREPLRAWYAALERLSPGRVLWTLPEDDAALTVVTPRTTRSDPSLFDALVDELPSP